MTHLAFIFPGSGSQYPAMASRLIKNHDLIKELFVEASDVLGWDLTDLCTKGGLTKLSKTKFLFPALHVTNVAHFKAAILEYECKPTVMLGHSLGEYSALTCAGAMSFADSVRVVARRAEIAAKAQAATVSATTIFKNTDLETVRKTLEEVRAQTDALVSLACINSDTQFMVTGEAKAVLLAEQSLLASDGSAEVVPLYGGAPYHSSLMTPYVAELRSALEMVTWHSPQISVISSATANKVETPDAIKDALARQLDHTVLWRGCIERIKDEGISCVAEVGPQSVLKNLLLETNYPGVVLAHDDQSDKLKLAEFGNPPKTETPEKTIMSAVERSFRSYPDAVAVRCETGNLTYCELDKKSSHLAHKLRSLGVGKDTPTAVSMPRSSDMIVAIFAILRAGGAYLPINAHHPADRVQTILRDSGAVGLITDTTDRLDVSFDGFSLAMDVYDWGAPVVSGELPEPQPEDLAYIIYTSGSTGRAKGVCTEHAALSNRLDWMQEAYPIGPADTILQKTVTTFDVSLWELLWWAMEGASVALLPSGKEHDPRAISRSIRTHNVTIIHFVPSVFELFLTYEEIKGCPEELSKLRFIFTSGEKLLVEAVQRFHTLTQNQPSIALVNLYGPTEAAIDVTYFNCVRGQVQPDVPIGKPITGIELHIVDEALKPIDGEGELLISGVGLARGYLNAEELTNAAFVNVPALNGLRAYRTGDLVTKDSKTGNYHYIGRNDFQIKLRGLRVELGEIEHVILQSRGVTSACVYADTDNPMSQNIFASIVGDGEVDIDDVQLNLLNALPEYMIPSRLLFLDAMPLSKNGKLDRKALLAQAKSVQGVTVDLRKASDVGGKAIQAQEAIPLTNGQNAMWVAQQLHPDRSLFTSPIMLKLKGILDVDQLSKAVELTVARHGQLRSGISSDRSVQVTNAFLPKLECLSTLPEGYKAGTPLPFATGRYDIERPLVRFVLVKLAQDEYLLQIDLDHILCDGWSKAVLIDDLLGFYYDTPTEMPGKTYIDHVSQLAEFVSSEKYDRQLDFWLKKLSGDLPVLSLPFDRRRPSLSARTGSFVDFSLPLETTKTLKGVAARNRVSFYNVLLAAYALFLNKHTSQADIIIGIPMAGRFEAAYERTFGLFVNSLPLRLDIDISLSFSQLLEKIKSESLNLIRNGSIGFEDIVKTVKPRRQGSAFPIYQTSFQLDSLPVPDLKRDALEADVLLNDTGISLLDLSISLHETGDGLHGTFEYDDELFDRETIERFAARYRCLLEAIAKDEAVECADLSIMCAQDFEAYERLNARCLTKPAHSSLWPLLKSALSEKGDAICIKDKGDEVSGKSLLSAVYRFTSKLADCGVVPGSRVASVMESSLLAIVAQLATFCIGAVWVPVDPKSPADRLAHVLNECEPLVLLLDSASAEFYGKTSSVLEGQTLIEVEPLEAQDLRVSSDDEDPSFEVPISSDAVILFTSGSTGRPKGVRLTHQGLAILVESFLESYDITNQDVLLPVTSVGSASYLGEVLPILIGGGQLLLVDQMTALDIDATLNAIKQDHVTILSTVPGLLDRLNKAVTKDDTRFESVRWLLSGGEALNFSQVDNLINHARVVNGYGLTEATICSTFYEVTAADNNTVGPLPIGTTVSETDAILLTENGTKAPIGVNGELYLSGQGLAAGYLREEQTDKAFVALPQTSDQVFLRTGDRVRMRPDGCLDYLDRVDRQVQIRGHRVELGDIETVLMGHPEIERAHLVLHEVQGGARDAQVLSAFYTTKTQVTVADSDLRAFVSAKLPAHMAPAAFVFLKDLPLSLNGKVDEAQLPTAQATVQSMARQELCPPRTDVEKKLATIWEDLLGGVQPAADANFFELGGNSLLLTDLQHQIAREFATKIELVELFSNPTIQSQAKLLDTSSTIEPTHEHAPDSAIVRKSAFAPNRWKPAVNA